MNRKTPAQSSREAKIRLRDEARAQRDLRPPDSSSLCQRVGAFLHEIEGFVVVYDALPGEVDLSELWERNDTKAQYAITRTPELGMDLTVHSVNVEMELHRWGFRQPVQGAEQIADEEIGAVLVPGLAFDDHGGRVGWGAGYYDRFLSRLTAQTLRIGISGGPLIDEVPMEAHDVAMTHVATASGIVERLGA